MLDKLRKEAIFITMISISFITIAVCAIMISDKLINSNDSKVINQFVYEQLSICNEKLAAYGEDVKLDTPKSEASAESLSICLEKLGAHGGDMTIPVTRNEAKDSSRRK